MFKVNNGNTRTMCEICSKLTIKTLDWRHCSGVSIVDFEQVMSVVWAQLFKYSLEFSKDEPHYKYLSLGVRKIFIFSRILVYRLFNVPINPFNVIGLFQYPQKTLKTLLFSGVFREYRKCPVARKGLTAGKCIIRVPSKLLFSLLKKWSFQLRISSVKVTKSAGDCRFGRICWRNP